MSQKTAIVLECAIARDYLRNSDLAITETTAETPFGEVDYLRMRSAEQEALVFENGGMNGRRPFSRAALPVFSVAYRENVDAMFSLGFAGSIAPDLSNGDFVVPGDVLDRTKDRPRSFVEEFSPGELFFYRMEEPFSPRLRSQLATAVEDLGFAVRDGGVHAVTEGPRFETAAEIAALREQGADTVSFSGIPDVYFARETDIEFGLGAFISNAGEGLDDVHSGEILETADEQQKQLTRITERLLQRPTDPPQETHHEQYWMQTPDESWSDPLE